MKTIFGGERFSYLVMSWTVWTMWVVLTLSVLPAAHATSVQPKEWDVGLEVGKDRDGANIVENGRLIAPQDQRVDPAQPSTVTVQAGASLQCQIEAATDWDHWVKRDPNTQAIIEEGEASDPVSYTWDATAGTMTPDGQDPKQALWQAPATPGSYVLECLVDDVPTAIVSPDTGSRDDMPVLRQVTVQVVAPAPVDALLRSATGGTGGTPGAWAGDGIQNSTGAGQTVQVMGKANEPAIYHLKIENQTTATDQIKVTAASAPTDWTVTFYDAETGGTDITADVTGVNGWTSGTLAASAAQIIRIEIEPDVSLSGGVTMDHLVTATSVGTPAESDTVKARTMVTDETAPWVTITAPAHNSTVDDVTAISGEAGDYTTGSGVAAVDVYLYRNWTGTAEHWNGTAWSTATPWTPLSASSETSWLRDTSLPTGSAMPDGWYWIRADAWDVAGNVSTVYSYFQLNRTTMDWFADSAINCGGIRYPKFPGASITGGTEGLLSSYLATDWDRRETYLSGVLSQSSLMSDPCSYTWSAVFSDGSPAGSFVNGVNTGQQVKWIAPNTPNVTVTLRLVVDDQNADNQANGEGGVRNDASKGYNDAPLTFTQDIDID